MRAVVTWSLIVAGAVAAVVALVTFAAAGYSSPDEAFAFVLPLSFVGAGAFGALHRPDHLAVQRLAAVGSLHLIGFALAGVVLLAGASAAVWPLQALSLIAYGLGFAALVGLFAVFPDGDYHRALERVVATAYGVAAVVLPLAAVLASPQTPLVVEPAGAPLMVPGPSWAGDVPGVATAVDLLFTAPLAGLALFAVRYRRADAARRRQMRWVLISLVAAAFVITLTALLGSLPEPAASIVAVTTIATLPASMVVGMVRHQLMDVDVLLRRSVVYALLALVIAGLHLGAAAALGIAVGERASVPVAVVVTIAAATAFQPARRRLERLADRMVYGTRVSGYDLIRSFGAGLAATVPAEQLTRRIADTVAQGLDATWVTVTRSDQSTATAGEAQDIAPAHTEPLVHDGVQLGQILLGPKREGAYGQQDLRLLDTLAGQAALAMRNASLAAELAHRLEELEASRTRLVAAEDAERRRIERDLHDGIQQELVAVLATTELARAHLAASPDEVDPTLQRVQDLVRQTQAHLREIVRGIHPAVLSDNGLVAAIESMAVHLPVGVEVVASAGVRHRRYPPHVEGAAYFLAAEALTNAAKHAQAEQLRVGVHEDSAALVLRVTDDGTGFDPRTVRASGLRGLRDRVEAAGGTLEIRSAPGAGTTVMGTIPLPRDADG